MSEDLWGKIIDKKPEVFFASDISQKVRDGFMSDLNLIIEQLGNYGPLEWWVLGQDIEKPSLTHDEALSNAPKASDGKFIVPPSLE